MSGHAFRPSVARVQNAQKAFTTTKTNATIRDLEEEEGELEEKEGTVVSIKRDLINGAGWTVKDKEGQTYTCSCASSMYEVPETVERGGILYPKEAVEVVFTVNPVLRINTIKEIKSLGEESEKLDISKWKHGDESTTVIAKPKSALSISDGFIKLDYNKSNQVIADDDAVKTKGKSTDIDTDTLNINSNNVNLLGKDLNELMSDNALNISNNYTAFDVEGPISVIGDRTNNMTQLHLSGKMNIENETVIGQIKDQRAIPVRKQFHLVTDGDCVDKIIIDTDGVITIEPVNGCTKERTFNLTYNWISPQILSRNYIKVTVNKTCTSCQEGNNNTMEYINYCPKCNSWNNLVDTGTSIRCSECNIEFCQNCGTDTDNQTYVLKKYQDNNISTYGTTCEQCNSHLSKGTVKEYVNYCPNCKTWGNLAHSERPQNNEIISIVKCSCGAEYCSTCGIDQDNYGIDLSHEGVSKKEYDNALRKLKYIRDGV